MIPILVSGSNPDSGSVISKETIDISFSLTDVTASSANSGSMNGMSYTSSIKSNYTATGQSVVIPRDPDNIQDGYVYYTPIYTEKISYEQWQSRINKNFSELEFCFSVCVLGAVAVLVWCFWLCFHWFSVTFNVLKRHHQCCQS